MAEPFTTRDGAKLHLGILASVNKFDAQIDQWISEVNQLFDTWLDRNILSKTYTNEYYSGNGTEELILNNWPVTALTSIYEDDTGYYGTVLNSFKAAQIALSTASWASSVATYTTASAHGLVAGQQVSVGGVTPAGYNISGPVTVTGANTFQILNVLTNPGSYSSGGTVYSGLSLLQNGVDYALYPQNEASGIVTRINGVWPEIIIRHTGQLSSENRPGTGNIMVTYTAGYATMPADLTLAANLVISVIKALSPFGRLITSEGYQERSVGFMNPWNLKHGIISPALPILAKWKRWGVGGIGG
jgi:hypothetical protein